MKRCSEELITLREMSAVDAKAVLRIYQEGIDTGHATFETEAPGWEDWNDRHLNHSRIIALIEGRVVGWAALSAVSSRFVYRGVAEVSIYVSLDVQGKRIGGKLIQKLTETSEAAGIWTLQAGIFPENKASIALHKAHGFRVLGVREKVGKMDYGPLAGIWRDVLLFERRSRTIGID
jgi:phosphinothricin acetyltransferase